MHIVNPFCAPLKAEELDDGEIAKLFVPEVSPVWEAVQLPMNHIVRGPRGSGKTAVLRRLRGPQGGRLGFYLQISRVAGLFRSLFSPKRLDRLSAETLHSYQRAFADYIYLELIREVLGLLPQLRLTADRTTALLDILLPVKRHRSAEEIVIEVDNLEENIEKKLSLWQITDSCDWSPLVDLSPALGRVTEFLGAQPTKKGGYITYLLLDESAPIPTQCQEVVNTLLSRGRPFRTKLAVRPFEWTTLQTLTGTHLEPDNDFQKLSINYPDAMSPEYQGAARQILNRVLQVRIYEQLSRPVGWSGEAVCVEGLFGLSKPGAPQTAAGFADICALSSSNPQNLLSLCSWIFRFAADRNEIQSEPRPEVKRLVQHEAMCMWSKDQEGNIPDSSLRSALSCILKDFRRRSGAGVSLNISIDSAERELFPSDYLPDELARVIQKGFALGLLRTSEDRELPWRDVPRQVTLSRVLLPAFDLPVRLSSSLVFSLDESSLRDALQEHFRPPLNPDPPVPGPRAFLSTSFAPTEVSDRQLLKEALSQVGILCEDVLDTPGSQFLFSTVFNHLKNSDFMVFNATEPRPYTLLELGLAAGGQRPKFVVPVINVSGERAIEDLPVYIRCLDLISFRIGDSGLSEAAARIRQRYLKHRAFPNEFSQILLTGVTLRPRRNNRELVYLSHAPSGLWDSVEPDLVREIEALGLRVINENSASLFQANQLQVPIFCSHLCRVAIVDMTGERGLDLLQCYILGVAVARGRQPVIRMVHTACPERGSFDSLPGRTFAWENGRDLLAIVLRQIKIATKREEA